MGKYLDTFSKMKSLSLDFNNNFENAIFSKLTQLEELRIYRCKKITDDIFDWLSNLEKLVISLCNITNQGIMKLKS